MNSVVIVMKKYEWQLDQASMGDIWTGDKKDLEDVCKEVNKIAKKKGVPAECVPILDLYNGAKSTYQLYPYPEDFPDLPKDWLPEEIDDEMSDILLEAIESPKFKNKWDD